MMERFKGMSPDEQKAVHRPDEGARPGHERVREGDAGERRRRPPSGKGAPKYGRSRRRRIDALFAPLPTVETRGRAWLFVDKQLKPVNLRLGITDGTNTELLSGELQQNMEVVTGVTGLGPTRTTTTGAGSGQSADAGPARRPAGRPRPVGRTRCRRSSPSRTSSRPTWSARSR